MQAALGERSTTRQLQSGMGELLGTLQHLEHGLQSMNDGDLTVAVDAELSPISQRWRASRSALSPTATTR